MPASTDTEDCLSVLGSSTIFSGLAKGERVAIAGGARKRSFQRNEILFMQGARVRQVLLVKSGCVKLTQISAEGNEVILWLSGSGDAVELLGLTPGGTHSCSARVVLEGAAFTWDYSHFEKFLERSPRIRGNISQIMSARLMELEERFREVATERVNRRVALALVRLLKQVGKHGNEGVEVSLSREELAQMTGTTLFSVSRLMTEWEGRGIVSPRRESVVIRDPERLWLEGAGPA